MLEKSQSALKLKETLAETGYCNIDKFVTMEMLRTQMGAITDAKYNLDGFVSLGQSAKKYKDNNRL